MTRSVCLFCSSADGLPAPARELAAEFGAACAARGLRLVYGGSGRGLMGIAARAAVAAGGMLNIAPYARARIMHGQQQRSLFGNMPEIAHHLSA